MYVANYASGNIGPHALLEMDEAASNVREGVIALSDVAAEAGVNKLTGQEGSGWRSEVCDGLWVDFYSVLVVQAGAVWWLDRF